MPAFIDQTTLKTIARERSLVNEENRSGDKQVLEHNKKVIKLYNEIAKTDVVNSSNLYTEAALHVKKGVEVADKEHLIEISKQGSIQDVQRYFRACKTELTSVLKDIENLTLVTKVKFSEDELSQDSNIDHSEARQEGDSPELRKIIDKIIEKPPKATSETIRRKAQEVLDAQTKLVELKKRKKFLENVIKASTDFTGDVIRAFKRIWISTKNPSKEAKARMMFYEVHSRLVKASNKYNEKVASNADLVAKLSGLQAALETSRKSAEDDKEAKCAAYEFEIKRTKESLSKAESNVEKLKSEKEKCDDDLKALRELHPENVEEYKKVKKIFDCCVDHRHAPKSPNVDEATNSALRDLLIPIIKSCVVEKTKEIKAIKDAGNKLKDRYPVDPTLLLDCIDNKVNCLSSAIELAPITMSALRRYVTDYKAASEKPTKKPAKKQGKEEEEKEIKGKTDVKSDLLRSLYSNGSNNAVYNSFISEVQVHETCRKYVENVSFDADVRKIMYSMCYEVAVNLLEIRYKAQELAEDRLNDLNRKRQKGKKEITKCVVSPDDYILAGILVRTRC